MKGGVYRTPLLVLGMEPGGCFWFKPVEPALYEALGPVDSEVTLRLFRIIDSSNSRLFFSLFSYLYFSFLCSWRYFFSYIGNLS